MAQIGRELFPRRIQRPDDAPTFPLIPESTPILVPEREVVPVGAPR